MTKVVVEFKVVKDIGYSGSIEYCVYANKDLISIEYNLRKAIRCIAKYIKGIEQKQKEGLPKVIYTDTYSYDR